MTGRERTAYTAKEAGALAARDGEGTKKAYDAMSVEELERELREAFFRTDRIDAPLSRELELTREALERKRPTAYLHTPEESWAAFLEDRGAELEGAPSRKAGPKKDRRAKPPRPRAVLRSVLAAAAVLVILAGAALAADSGGLLAWVPGWNASTGRYVPISLEAEDLKPIPAALAELGITEPVYPTRLPEGFVPTGSLVRKDPLILVEQYARGDRLLSITVTPTEGFRTAIYQMRGEDYREYASGAGVYYLFENEGAITAVWYTENYTTSISGNLSLAEIKGIIDSFREAEA